jgi:hypothetical protein
MPADNRAALTAATQQRAETTRARARARRFVISTTTARRSP